MLNCKTDDWAEMPRGAIPVDGGLVIQSGCDGKKNFQETECGANLSRVLVEWHQARTGTHSHGDC